MGIGEQLSHTRKSKGLSLEAAEEATKIRARFLRALEEEEFTLLPGRVYAKAFLRSYARYLGLDDAALAREFDALWAAEPGPEIKRRWLKKKRRALNWGRYTNLLLVVAVVGLLFAFNAVYKVVFGVSAERRPAVVQQEERRSPAGKPRADNQPAPAGREMQSPTQQPRAGEANEPMQEVSRPQGLTVTLEVVNGECWVRVVADGETAFEGTLRAGMVRSFKAQDKIRLRLGNAGAVVVSCNGQNLGHLGGIGQVVTREFSAVQG